MGGVERRAAGVLLANVLDMPVRWGVDAKCSPPMRLRLVLALDRPIHNCVYLALANRIGAIMSTADSRLANAVAVTGHGGSVLTRADYTKTG